MEKHTEADIRLQVQKIVCSDLFAKSKRARDLLVFLVDQTLTDPACQLDGYSIGLDFFQKDPEFDPAKSSTVRVQIGRLRKLLLSYYESIGKDDPIILTLPVGTNKPSWARSGKTALKKMRDVPPVPTRAPDVPNQAVPSKSVRHVGAGLLILLLISAFAYNFSVGQVSTNTSQSMSPLVKVLPFQSYTSDPVLKVVARKLELEVSSYLSKFQLIDTALSEKEPRLRSSSKKITYLVKGALFSNGDVSNFTIVVSDASDNQMVWSNTYPLSKDATGQYDQTLDIARVISSHIAMPAGPVLAHSGSSIQNDTRKAAKTSYAQHGCVLTYLRHRDDYLPDSIQDIETCLQDYTKTHPRDGRAFAILSMFYSDQANLNGSQKDLKVSLDYAKQAISKGPSSDLAHHAHGLAQIANKNYPAAINAFQKAYALNPANPDNMATLGMFLCIENKWEEGISLVNTALNDHLAAPPWYRIPVAMNAYRIGDFQTALYEAMIQQDTAPALSTGLIIASAFKLERYDVVDKYAPLLHHKLEAQLGRPHLPVTNDLAENVFSNLYSTDLLAVQNYLQQQGGN